MNIHKWITVGAPDFAVTRGSWYYEFVFGRGVRNPQIGWATTAFRETATYSQGGVGDDEESWAADPLRLIKRHGHIVEPVRWGTMDHQDGPKGTLGCGIDLEAGEMWFTWKGKEVALSGFRGINLTTPVYPAFSCSGTFKVNFGQSDFAYPPDKRYGRMPLGLVKDGSCSCRWPPLGAKHNCPLPPFGPPAEDKRDIVHDATALSTALNELSQTCRSGHWDCTPNGVMNVDHALLFCKGGRIRRLYLFGMNLTGTLSTALCEMEMLEGLYIDHNRITGTLPKDLGRLSRLESLHLEKNLFTGGMPTTFAQLKVIKFIYLNSNRLNRPIPPECGYIQSLEWFWMQDNMIPGSIPSTIGRLNMLGGLTLNNNSISGTIPPELAGLTGLKGLHLARNALRGTIPPELGRLSVQYIRFESNRLEGTIPANLSHIPTLRRLEFQTNKLRGPIPTELGMLSNALGFTVLNLGDNKLSGTIPSELGSIEKLSFLGLDKNSLHGTVPDSMGRLTQLTHMFIHRNSLSGSLPESLTNLKVLHSMFLFYNKLRGTLPESICELESLHGLYLQHNHLTGTLPSCVGDLSQLEFLMLGHNDISGSIPVTIGRLRELKVLTVHENYFNGHILPGTFFLKTDDPNNKAVLMLQKNDLSCELPPVVLQNQPDDDNMDSVKFDRAVILGNMLNGPLPAWVGKTEQASELLYNHHPGSDVLTWMVVGPGSFVVVAIVSRCVMKERMWTIMWEALAEPTQNSLVLLYRELLRACASLFIIPCLLLLLFRTGHGKYECGKEMARATAAYFDSTPAVEWCVAILWCLWLAILTIATGSVNPLKLRRAKKTVAARGASQALQRVHAVRSDASRQATIPERSCAWRFAGCLSWTVIVCTLSWPSLLYAVVGSLPEDNILQLQSFRRNIIYYSSPFLQAMMDSLIAPRAARRHGRLFGFSVWSLQIWARMVTSWLVLTVAAVYMLENCAGYWKSLWKVCKPDSTQLDITVKLQNPMDNAHDDIEIKALSTIDEVCLNHKDTWWCSDRCDRALIERLAPFLSFRLSVAAFGMPLAYTFRLRCLNVDPEHLLQRQSLVLTSVCQVATIWVPFVPILMPIVVAALMLHLVACYLCSSAGPKINMGGNPTWLLLGSLRPSLLCGALLMVHYAFTTDMHGQSAVAATACLGTPWIFFVSIVESRGVQERYRGRFRPSIPVWLEWAAEERTMAVIKDPSMTEMTELSLPAGVVDGEDQTPRETAAVQFMKENLRTPSGSPSGARSGVTRNKIADIVEHTLMYLR